MPAPPPDRLARLDAFPGLFGRKPEWLQALGVAAGAGHRDAAHLREALLALSLGALALLLAAASSRGVTGAISARPLAAG